MIEVEKNFDLKPGQREQLTAGAKLIGHKVMTDSYYDSADFSLTRRDYWLRRRNNQWELKVPFNSAPVGDRATDRYHELETEPEIIAALNLPSDKPLEQSLAEAGYAPFVTIITNRDSYQQGDWHLDFDEMDFGFVTFEAELMVPTESDVPAAEARIAQFAEVNQLDGTRARGKVIEYLYRYRREHYQALVTAGVVQES